MGETYRQVTHILRIPSKLGGTHKVSERPREKKSGRFLDSPENPTLIVIDESDAVDVDYLLRIGAIERYEPPRSGRGPKKEPAGEEVSHGQGSEQGDPDLG